MVLTLPGLNLSYLVDYRQQCPWKNELRCARIWWEADLTTGNWIQSRLTNENAATGMPASLPGGRQARTVMGTGAFQESRTWAVDFGGEGEIEVAAGSTTRTRANYVEFARNAGSSVSLSIRDTNPANPIRDLWIGEQRYHQDRNGQHLLKEPWIDHIRAAGVRVVRFMQWQHISPAGDSGNDVRAWLPGVGVTGMKPPWNAAQFNLDRQQYFTDSGYIQGNGPTPDSQMGNGCTFPSILIAAIELQLTHIVVCVPHRVNEGAPYVDWVEQMLAFVRDFRHPTRNVAYLGAVIVEYSNETWNSSFPQHSYCNARGIALGLDGEEDHEQGNSFYALRSSQIFTTALQARTTLGLQNRVERMLAGQAGAGEYAFRFRSQIGALQPAPVNVEAEYWSPGSYYANTDWANPGGDPPYNDNRILIGDRSINNGNPWLSAAQWTALSDAEIETMCRRDVDNRVFMPVTTFNDGRFSVPTLRAGGILADMQFAVARGMQVVCYEGGNCHIVIPNDAGWDQAARDRSVNWQTTSRCGDVTLYNLDRHVTAGVIGTLLFDEGTLWAGQFGCWSWYRDHRDGYGDDVKYVAAAQHMNTGVGNLASTMPYPEVILRAGQMAGVLGLGNIASSLASATVEVAAGQMHGVFMGAPVDPTELAPAVIVVSAGAMEGGDLSDPMMSELEPATVVASAGRMIGSLIGQPIALESLLASATVEVTAGQMAGDLDAGAISSRLGSALVLVCITPMSGRLTGPTILSSLMSSANVVVKTSALRGVLAGQSGTLTGPTGRRFFGTLTHSREIVPHGTTIYRGQILGWIGNRVRPYHAGDQFAGFAAETVLGWEWVNGQRVMRTTDYGVRMVTRGQLWAVLPNSTIGAPVWAKNDADLTLQVVVADEFAIGRVTQKRSGRTGVYFEGTAFRVQPTVQELVSVQGPGDCRSNYFVHQYTEWIPWPGVTIPPPVLEWDVYIPGQGSCYEDPVLGCTVGANPTINAKPRIKFNGGLPPKVWVVLPNANIDAGEEWTVYELATDNSGANNLPLFKCWSNANGYGYVLLATGPHGAGFDFIATLFDSFVNARTFIDSLFRVRVGIYGALLPWVAYTDCHGRFYGRIHP